MSGTDNSPILSHNGGIQKQGQMCSVSHWRPALLYGHFSYKRGSAGHWQGLLCRYHNIFCGKGRCPTFRRNPHSIASNDETGDIRKGAIIACYEASDFCLRSLFLHCLTHGNGQCAIMRTLASLALFLFTI